MRSVQSKGYSEKAEVENVFLEAVEEVKKDLSKHQSTRLAVKSSSKGIMNTKEATMDRVGEYFESPQKFLMEQVVDNKHALMEIFDEIFGHGGYSGVAF
jgi:hypothetical protein